MNRSSPYFCGTCSVDHQAKCHVLTCRHASASASSYSHGVWLTLLLATFGKMNWRCCWPTWRSNGNSMKSKMREPHTGWWLVTSLTCSTYRGDKTSWNLHDPFVEQCVLCCFVCRNTKLRKLCLCCQVKAETSSVEPSRRSYVNLKILISGFFFLNIFSNVLVGTLWNLELCNLCECFFLLRSVFKFEGLMKTVAEAAMSITRTVVDAQNSERKVFMEHMKQSYSENVQIRIKWQKIIQQLSHERAVWFFPDSYPR